MFWQDFKQANVDTRYWVTFRPSRVVGKLRAIITIPPFEILNIPWIGPSYIGLEFRSNLSENFSILRPITIPQNPTFCLAIRSVHDWINSNQYTVDRFKLWNNVGENLFYPDYSGEVICKSFALEIWNCIDQPDLRLTENLVLETSILRSVEDCCNISPEDLPIVEVCQLFAEFPIDFP